MELAEKLKILKSLEGELNYPASTMDLAQEIGISINATDREHTFKGSDKGHILNKITIEIDFSKVVVQDHVGAIEELEEATYKALIKDLVDCYVTVALENE